MRLPSVTVIISKYFTRERDTAEDGEIEISIYLSLPRHLSGPLITNNVLSL